jgi:tubulin monoglycylase TTLL3/8
MKPRKRSFEIFGYDFMIDVNFNTWLIEINSSPSMDHSTWLTSNLAPRVIDDLVKIVIDNQVKKPKKKVGNFSLIYSSDSKI